MPTSRAVLTGEETSPGATSSRKAEMGQALSDPDGLSHCGGSSNEQYIMLFFLQINSFQIKFKFLNFIEIYLYANKL
jgi:hypothetical protein